MSKENQEILTTRMSGKKNLSTNRPTKQNSDTSTLIPFTGYYTHYTGAISESNQQFLTVETKVQGDTQQNNVTIIVSLEDGSVISLDFSGNTEPNNTFDGSHLKYSGKPEGSDMIYKLDLMFSRPQTADYTAEVKGTITVIKDNGHAKGKRFNIDFQTYNNPIPISNYSGTYYDDTGTKVLTIRADGSILYLSRTTKSFTQVKDYTYNSIMYFFSFMDGDIITKLIMGTSPAGGVVCNNMTVENDVPKSRNLTSIKVTQSITMPSKELNTNSEKLANFSGFYKITAMPQLKTPDYTNSIEAGAYIAIQGLYVSSFDPDANTVDRVDKVTVGISFDGEWSEVYTFDKTCKFSELEGESGSWILRIPIPTMSKLFPEEKILVLIFKPEYEAAVSGSFNYGNLVQLEGAVEDLKISPDGHPNVSIELFTGSTPLGPVPLSAFGGKIMKSNLANEKDTSLLIESDYSVKYRPVAYKDQIPMNDILYVPLMYILVYKVTPSQIDNMPTSADFMFSLGTDEIHGLACINTNYSQYGTKGITSVYGQPGEILPESND